MGTSTKLDSRVGSNMTVNKTLKCAKYPCDLILLRTMAALLAWASLVVFTSVSVFIGFVIHTDGHRDPRSPSNWIKIPEFDSFSNGTSLPNGNPFIVRKARIWPKAMLWDEHHIAKVCSSGLPNIHVQEDNGLFVHHDDQFPLQVPSNRSYTIPLSSPSRFFNQVKKGTSPFMYFGEDLADICDGKLNADIEPVTPFLLGRNDVSQRLIWIGGKGVVTNTHFDAYENVYLQIKGRKQFLLSPPTDYYKMAVYPRMHPSDRQSRIEWVDSNDPPLHQLQYEFPEFLNITIWEATLEPGDVLYLPPFWFHRVAPLSHLSISANVWSQGTELDIINAIFNNPLPYFTDLPELYREQRISVLRTYILELLKHCFSLVEINLFISHLNLQLAMYRQECPHIPCMDFHSVHQPILIDAAKATYDIYFIRLRKSTLPIVLGNLIEMTSLHILGTTESAICFISQCL